VLTASKDATADKERVARERDIAVANERLVMLTPLSVVFLKHRPRPRSELRGSTDASNLSSGRGGFSKSNASVVQETWNLPARG
jgi:hypothetical protein